MDRYHINVSWSDEDGCWVADVADLRFCSAHGDTPEEAVREARIAMAAWLESARGHGDPVPEPRHRPAIDAGRGSA